MQRGKYIVAALIAVVGLVVAGRALMRGHSSGRLNSDAIQKDELTPEVEAMVSGDFDTIPTASTVDAVIENATARVVSAIPKVGSPVLSAPRRKDLADAFHGLFSAIVAPDVERDELWRESRGKKPLVDALTPQQIEQMQSSAEYFALPKMNLSELKVIPVYQSGKLLLDDPTEQGFAINVTRLAGAYPIPDDPVEGRLDVVEVRFPMELPNPRDGGRSRASIGIQFAWSEERKQWIPYGNVSYRDPNTAVLTPIN